MNWGNMQSGPEEYRSELVSELVNYRQVSILFIASRLRTDWLDLSIGC